MKFVFGKPHKLVEPGWYLVLDSRDAEERVALILTNNAKRFVSDPHGGEISAHLALITTRLAMEIYCGLHDRLGFYVGRSGGMCPNLVEIIEEREGNEWPDKPRVSIGKWPNGKQYYARVDDIDLEWRGSNKWNTESAAQKAADEYIKTTDEIKVKSR